MRNEELQKKIEVLENEIASLKASSTIPFEIDKAFSDRFKLNSFSKVILSSKASNSEQIAVNSAGSTPVLLAPDAFLQVTISGTIYYIPAFT